MLRGTGHVTPVMTRSLSLVICPGTLTFSLHVTRIWSVTNHGGHANLFLPEGEMSLPKVTSACPTHKLHFSLIRFKTCAQALGEQRERLSVKWPHLEHTLV